MIINEEFQRCEKCEGGWFKIERRVLVREGSPSWAPFHHKTEDIYICTNCGHEQYNKTVEED